MPWLLVMHKQNQQVSSDFAPRKSARAYHASTRKFSSLRFCQTDNRLANAWRSKGGCSWITYASPHNVHPSFCISRSTTSTRARGSGAGIFAACRAASGSDACQFELFFDHVTTFRTSPRNAIVQSGNGGPQLLRQLQVQIGIDMRNLGEDARINRNFQPHATVLYDREVMPRVALQKPVVVAAREFVLLRNRPGGTWLRYVDRWPLWALG
jgi:RNA 2',3'-cyclic 3'-phosphodiesterase